MNINFETIAYLIYWLTIDKLLLVIKIISNNTEISALILMTIIFIWNVRQSKLISKLDYLRRTSDITVDLITKINAMKEGDVLGTDGSLLYFKDKKVKSMDYRAHSIALVQDIHKTEKQLGFIRGYTVDYDFDDKGNVSNVRKIKIK